MPKYTLAELNAIPTISHGQFDDLKIETETTRTWLSRMTIEDGQPYNNMVTVEEWKNGKWIITERYEALKET